MNTLPEGYNVITLLQESQLPQNFNIGEAML